MSKPCLKNSDHEVIICNFLWSRDIVEKSNKLAKQNTKIDHQTNCSMTEIYPSAPIDAFISESSLISTLIILYFRPKLNNSCNFCLPD